MSVKLVSISKGVGPLEDKSAEDIISYVARVSNPNNQSNFDTAGKLLAYCIKNNHWSVFETVFMTVEIVTSRAISSQLLRHRSAVFQESSQRYQQVSNFTKVSPRRQDSKNRQNSVDDLSTDTQDWFNTAYNAHISSTAALYEEALSKGIAKESARMLLPMSVETTLYMTNNVRNWIHYIELRTSKGTQLEHRVIAEEVKQVFISQFPTISNALGWVV